MAKNKINFKNQEFDGSVTNILLYAISNDMTEEVSPLIDLISNEFINTGLDVTATNIKRWLIEIIEINENLVSPEQIISLDKVSLEVLQATLKLINKSEINQIEEKVALFKPF